MSTTKESSETQIELLTEHNFHSWLVDIRAKLRTKELWKYTQSQSPEDEAEEATNEAETIPTPPTTAAQKRRERALKIWEENTQKAADLMTPTISRALKMKLSEAEFNDGYLMLTKLRLELQPSGSSEFMRLSKEYYTLQYKSFKSMSECLTRIKVLEEKIDATKVVLDTDNRTILCLSMLLPQEYQYLVQIWAVTPSITAEKARQMVLEASRQHHQALHNSHDPALAMRAEGHRDRCKHCGSDRHPEDKCYLGNPDKAPQWFKDKMEAKAKDEGKAGKQARKFQAKLATRGDDFTDSNSGTHFSALAMS